MTSSISTVDHLPMFVLQGVAKVYPKAVALAPFSLEIEEEERVAVLGPSGGGKTTLLHLMGGVIQQDQGSIFIGAGR